MRYRRVTLEDRYEIGACLKAHFSRTEIAHQLGFHKSTITRELKRNKIRRDGYKPSSAEFKTRKRHKESRKAYSITPELEKLIHDKMMLGWTPLEISGRMKTEEHAKSSGSLLVPNMGGMEFYQQL